MPPRRFTRIAATVGLVATLGLGTASCTTETAGTPAAAERGNVLFDPCAIPDSTLQAAGVGEFVERGFLGGARADWDSCVWRSSWYHLTTLSTVYTLDAIRDDPNSYDFRPISVNGRRAITYQSHIDDPDTGCDVAYPWSRGVVIIRISALFSKKPPEPVCAVALRMANALEPGLPRQ